MGTDYRIRLVDRLLDDLLGSLPAILLVGPRAAGKTTTALRRAATVLRLDRPADAAAMANDPDAVLGAAPPPVLIDEWQLVPEVLGAVKRLVDAGSQPGQILLTGSSAADLEGAGWPATGRVVRVPIWPMTVRERLGRVAHRSLVDRCFDGDLHDLEPPDSVPNVVDYVALALHSGFPALIDQPDERVRRTWLRSYVDQVVLRDAPLAGYERDPRRLRAYLGAIAACSASTVTHKTLYDAAGVTRQTALAYDSLLELLLVTERVPAWSSNRLRQLTKTPKRYVAEPGLLGALLQVDAAEVVRDGRAVGSVIDTFVTAQVRSELTVSEARPTMLHLRQADGRHEVDLMLQGPAGRIVAIEIKAHASPTVDMARHLRWLRGELGDQLAAGVVFHTGPRPFLLDERIWALPIWSLWG